MANLTGWVPPNLGGAFGAPMPTPGIAGQSLYGNPTPVVMGAPPAMQVGLPTNTGVAPPSVPTGTIGPSGPMPSPSRGPVPQPSNPYFRSPRMGGPNR